MRKMISTRTAAKATLTLLGFLMLFHILVLLRLIPPGIVWGGRVDDSAGRLIILEAVGVILTLVIALIVAIKAQFLRMPRLLKAAGVAMWIVFGYFVFNIIGNLAAQTTTEKIIFTPVAIILGLLSLRLALDKP